VSEAFVHIDSEYVEPPDFGLVTLGALRDLQESIPDGRFQVDKEGEGLVITYREVVGDPSRLTLPLAANRGDALRDVTAAYDIARQVAPSLTHTQLEESLLRGALRGLDPLSSFMDCASHREMLALSGGVGLEITMRNNRVVVVAAIATTPAWRAGLQPGDILVKVDGVPTERMSLTDVVKRLRGPRATTLTLAVLRRGLEEPLDFVMVREIIRVQAVRSWEPKPGVGIGYIWIRQFPQGTGREVEADLERLKAGRLAGLIVDLRDNPGGLLTEGIEVAGQFLGNGKLVVSWKARVPDQNRRFVAQARHPMIGIPLVVLVNEGSRGASEIIAAAIQDHGRGVVLGTQTSGASSLSTIIPLSDGSELRFTTAKFFTPKGRSVLAQGSCRIS